MKNLTLSILGIALSLSFIYGCYWVAKTVSYSVFYEDMVQETIREMVESESLNP
jgi:hypothetical protein